MTVTEAAPPIRAIHRISSIVIGERGNRDVTGLDELKASITGLGLVHPLILTPDRHLVLGARRLEACRQLGWTDVPAMTVTWIWQALDYLETEHRDPRCLRPLTVQEAMGMDMALRELRWWAKEAVPPGMPERHRGNERRQRIAGLLGMNQHQYFQARELSQAASGYKEAFGQRHPVPLEEQERATQLLAAITSKGDIFRTHGLYRNGDVPARTAPREVRTLPVRSTRGDGRRSPQRAQATQIQQGLASISGTLAALMHIRSVSETVPDGQLDDWADDITDLIRDLSTFRRRLSKGQR